MFKEQILNVGSWPKYEAQVVRLTVSFGEIAWLFKKNYSNSEIYRSHSQ
jgi:hypothetical protein